MKREDIRVCIMKVGGTNCDAETKRSLEDLGVKTNVIHLNEIVKRKERLLDYSALVFPGGFSYGDYVRAGAILAKWVMAKLDRELKQFINEERPILGICNGFQVLVEAGLLPAFDGVSDYPEAALGTNIPPGYNCRWIYIKNESRSKCAFTWTIPKRKVLKVPVAHSEGRFLFQKEREAKFLERLYENYQLVFRYCDENGTYADGEYPVNPNGSFHDIAGICDQTGTIFGLMPHPERAYYGWQQSDWTRMEKVPHYGDGKIIFESLIEYLVKRL